MKESQNERILRHLQSGGTLTQAEAFHAPFRCGRLASRIHDLKQQGHAIKSTSVRVGRDGVIVSRYYMEAK